MILNLYPLVAVKIGDERYEFALGKLMFTEMAEIERATGMSAAEWKDGLDRSSILSLAALLHMLRKRAGVPSNFGSMEFQVSDLDIVPLHEDGTEYTRDEITEDIQRRVEETAEPVPTSAATSAAGQQTPAPGTTATTSPSSPKSSISGRGNGTSSRPPTSRRAKPTSTPAPNGKVKTARAPAPSQGTLQPSP